MESLSFKKCATSTLRISAQQLNTQCICILEKTVMTVLQT